MGVVKMLTIKNLKPYRVTCDHEYFYVTLAYRYFDVLINDEIYQFIPIEAKIVQFDRHTRQIVNTNARFAFQKENKIIYVQMIDLMALPQFIQRLNQMIDTFMGKKLVKEQTSEHEDIELLIATLEQENIKRLIDRALDEKDEQSFI